MYSLIRFFIYNIMVAYIIPSYDSICAYMAFKPGEPFYESINNMMSPDQIKTEDAIEEFFTKHDIGIHGGITYVSRGENRRITPLYAKDYNLKNYLHNAIVIGWDYLHDGDEYTDLIDKIKDVYKTVNLIENGQI